MKGFWSWRGRASRTVAASGVFCALFCSGIAGNAGVEAATRSAPISFMVDSCVMIAASYAALANVVRRGRDVGASALVTVAVLLCLTFVASWAQRTFGQPIGMVSTTLVFLFVAIWPGSVAANAYGAPPPALWVRRKKALPSPLADLPGVSEAKPVIAANER